MSLKPDAIPPVPTMTVQVAHAAFSKGNPYLTLRDELGVIFADIEGTISQGVRAFTLRQTRYRSLAKTRLQHIAAAAALNLERLVAWFLDTPRATTRTSRFAALAPA